MNKNPSLLLIILIFTVLLAMPPTYIPSVKASFPATITLRPNANGDETAWTNDYDECNDSNDATYISCAYNNYYKELFQLEDMPEAFTIYSLVIYVRMRITANGASQWKLKIMAKSGVDINYSSEINLAGVTTWTNYSFDITSWKSWNQTLVNELQAGVYHNDFSGFPADGQCSEVWAEVTYSGPLPTVSNVLWVDSFNSSYSEWTEIGSSPYLNAVGDDSYIEVYPPDSDSHRQGDFSFQNATENGSVGSIYLDVLWSYQSSKAIVKIWLWNGSWNLVSDQLADKQPAAKWYTWRSIDVSGIIDSWAEVQSAKVRINKTAPEYGAVSIDAMRLRLGPTIKIEHAGNGQENYVALSRQKENFIYINTTITDSDGLNEIKLEWFDGIWNYYTMSSSGSVYYKNMTGLTNGTDYTFNIYAKDNNGNSFRQNWTKTNLLGYPTQKYFRCAYSTEVWEYKQYYFYDSAYERTQSYCLAHEQGTDGSIQDTGYLRASPPSEAEERFCLTYVVFWLDENTTIEETSIDNIYYRIWWLNDAPPTPNNVELRYYKKKFAGMSLPPLDSEGEKIATLTWNATGITKDFAGRTYALSVGYFDTSLDLNVIDNDVYEFCIVLMKSNAEPRPVSAYGMPSYIIVNLPSNATLQGYDSDSDGINDHDELYACYTDPLVSDTDKDNLFDNDDPEKLEPEHPIYYGVDGFTSTFTEWVEIGSSPYLDGTRDSKYIKTDTADNKEGNFTFENAPPTMRTFNDVQILIYSSRNTSASNGYIYFWDNSESQWVEESFVMDRGYSWKKVNVTQYLTSWTEINETIIYLKSADAKWFVDCVLIRVNLTGFYDVAVVDVKRFCPKESLDPVTEGYTTWTIDVNVTVKNLGTYDATFDVTANYENASGKYVIGTETDVTLAARESTTVNFKWKTDASVQTCVTYTISANASIVLGDINVTNNYLADGTYKVKILGDTNNDDFVEGLDLSILGLNWYKAVPPANPQADFTFDVFIDGLDLSILGLNWYKGCP